MGYASCRNVLRTLIVQNINSANEMGHAGHIVVHEDPIAKEDKDALTELVKKIAKRTPKIVTVMKFVTLTMITFVFQSEDVFTRMYAKNDVFVDDKTLTRKRNIVLPRKCAPQIVGVLSLKNAET